MFINKGGYTFLFGFDYIAVSMLAPFLYHMEADNSTILVADCIRRANRCDTLSAYACCR